MHQSQNISPLQASSQTPFRSTDINMADAPSPSGSDISPDIALQLLSQAYDAGAHTQQLLDIPPLTSSEDETASLFSEDEAEEKTSEETVSDLPWRPAASFLSADVLALANDATLPNGRPVLEVVSEQRALDAGCARMIFDHHCVEAAQHFALVARAQRSEITLAHAVRAATEAVVAAVDEAQASAARDLQATRCNVTVMSRPDGKCRSLWRSCPIVAHARVRGTVGLPHRDTTPCARHPRIIRSSCSVCMRRRRLRLLFSLHEPFV